MKIRVEVSVKPVNIHVQVENKVKILKVNKWKLYYSIVMTNLEVQTHAGVVFKKLECGGYCSVTEDYWSKLMFWMILNNPLEQSYSRFPDQHISRRNISQWLSGIVL